jgi:hydrocephalus-inducing protein
MGTVIGPTFQFSESRINFGTISYGFPVSHDVIFKNTSEVSMTYRLHIPTDDDNEFTIQPNEGELPPSVQKIVKVTITPTSVKTYNTVLMVDIAEAGNELYSLPLQANSIVPKVVLETTSLHYGRCFIYHPYTIDIQLQNTSILPVKYRMMEQNEKKLIEYSTTHPHGVINGHQCLTLPLTIRPTSVGQLTSTASIEILGSSDPPLYIQLHCIGEGPVISIHPDILDWGYCSVLTPTDKRLVINNESEIDAEFQAYLVLLVSIIYD